VVVQPAYRSTPWEAEAKHAATANAKVRNTEPCIQPACPSCQSPITASNPLLRTVCTYAQLCQDATAEPLITALPAVPGAVWDAP
jgi:hypothetical protein